MFQLKQVINSAKKLAFRCQDTIKRYCALFVLGFMYGMQAYAQGAGGFSKATQEISTYSGPVQKLMYAIAAVIALVGAFNVYFKMQNGDQDVKNILVLQNRQETRRKEMKLNSLLHNTLWRYFNFPIFENVLLKNI